MCYSTKEREAYREFVRRYGAILSIDEFVRMIRQREQADELGFSMNIPEEMIMGLIDHLGDTAAAREIEKSHLRWKAARKLKLEHQLVDEQEKLRVIEEKLARKWSQTADKQRSQKANKVASIRRWLDELRTPKRGDYRVFPFMMAPMIIEEDGKRLIVPARFRILQKSGSEAPGEVFNARRETLHELRTWKPLYGQQHGIIPFATFYERVELPDGSNVELEFTPSGGDMHSACLYQNSIHPALGLVRSYALVTSDPPAEISEAGHDRCPIFIANRVVDEWLNPQGKSVEELDVLLDEKEPTHYSHKIAA